MSHKNQPVVAAKSAYSALDLATPVRVGAAANVAVVGRSRRPGHGRGTGRAGHNVVGLDRSSTLVAELNAGEVMIHESGLRELVEKNRSASRLEFTTSYEEAIPEAGFVFLAVDTPSTLGGAADLRNIRSATASSAAPLNGQTPVIVNKSTSPIGTGETIEGTRRTDE